MAAETVLPSHDDPVARELAGGVGGPVGRYARTGAHSFWTPLRVLLAFAMLTFGLGWLLKAPCRTHSWAEQYQYTRMCYSDVYALYFSEGLAEGKVPYADHPVEYPVVIGGVMYAVASVVDTARGFFDLTSLLLLVCALVAVAATKGAAGRRPWDAAFVALAPGLALHGTTNWDLVAVALAALGVLAWARGRPGLAGLWFGVGAAAKLYPLLFFGPLLLLCLRAGRMRAFAQALGAAIVTWVAVNLPVAVTHGDSWREFYRLNRTRPADWDSLYYAAARIGESFGVRIAWDDVNRLNLLVAVLFLVACAAIAVLALTAPRRPRLPQLLFLVLAAFLLVNKVNSPQFTLWLIPLAALARPRWRAFLVWQALELLVMFTRYYLFVNLASPPDGVPVGWFVAAVLLRDAALLWIVVQVVREVRRPGLDVVRRDGVDDPAGGVLDGAPEWMVPAPEPAVPAAAR